MSQLKILFEAQSKLEREEKSLEYASREAKAIEMAVSEAAEKVSVAAADVKVLAEDKERQRREGQQPGARGEIVVRAKNK